MVNAVITVITEIESFYKLSGPRFVSSCLPSSNDSRAEVCWPRIATRCQAFCDLNVELEILEALAYNFGISMDRVLAENKFIYFVSNADTDPINLCFQLLLTTVSIQHVHMHVFVVFVQLEGTMPSGNWCLGVSCILIINSNLLQVAIFSSRLAFMAGLEVIMSFQ
uniref:Uncharacterized protein n=1 Tax=Glossina austeni TaxID=7395 RepID=A0A1A9VF97_GLOAU